MSPLLHVWFILEVSARACELRGLSDTVPSPNSREVVESWAAGRDWGDLVGESPASGEKGEEMRGSYGEGGVMTGDRDCVGRIERDWGAGVVWENMSGLYVGEASGTVGCGEESEGRLEESVNGERGVGTREADCEGRVVFLSLNGDWGCDRAEAWENMSGL